MTLAKLNAHCDRTGFTAEINGDTMTAVIFNLSGSKVMTVALY